MPKTIIEMYVCKDNSNTINKALENKISIPVDIKNFADIDNFDCIMKNTQNTTFTYYNYVVINNFGGLKTACYFITNKELKEYNTISLSLKLDVLETFKEDILNAGGIVSHETLNENNKMYAKSFENNLLSSFEIEQHKFPIQLNKTNSKILITVGSV